MESEKFKCGKCGKKFNTKESLIQHTRDAHETKTGSEKVRIPVKKYAIYAIAALILIGFGYGLYILITSVQNVGSANINNFTLPSYAVNRGSDSANVTIVEFGDYQCPVCQAFFIQSEPQMMEDYVNSGKAKFYFLDFSFLGPDSFTLAQGSWCANEQGKYYDFHDYVYSNQGVENSGWATPAEVNAFASNIQDIDVQNFTSCLDSGRYQSRIQEANEFARSYGVGATPTFIIGRPDVGFTMIVGNQPYLAIQQVIEKYLK